MTITIVTLDFKLCASLTLSLSLHTSTDSECSLDGLVWRKVG